MQNNLTDCKLSFFSSTTGFDISCLLSCNLHEMSNLLCRLLKNLPSVLSVNWPYARYYIYVCVCVLFGRKVIFKNPSVITRRCLDIASISVLTFRVLHRWILRPFYFLYLVLLTRYSTQSYYTDTELTTPGSKIFFLNLGRQAKEQLAQFLKLDTVM